MARYQYENQQDTIRGIARYGSKAELVDWVAKHAKQINQRFYRLEKADLGTKDTAYRYAQASTGKEKPRYSTSINVLNQMTNEQLLETALDINAKLASKTSTKLGLETTYSNRIKGATKALNNSGIDITEEELNRLIDAGGGDILNQYASEQIIEEWMEFKDKISPKQFLNEIKRYKKNAPDRNKLRKAWNKIALKMEEKRNKK